MTAYLAKLNPEQRRAVEHGVGASAADNGPLLVIAGAGSGKTNTLAHRVAHLIVNGIDPRRLLLMTFSRRAAAEMERRVQRIVAAAPGGTALAAAALTWSGTFHSVGARLLREFAEQIGLAPAFTIHDRTDSADLMNLARHELRLTKTENRFPTKATCLAIYSRTVNAQAALADVLAPAFAGEIADRFDHVLVDEYQDTNKLQAAVLLALKPDGRGLTVVGDDAQS